MTTCENAKFIDPIEGEGFAPPYYDGLVSFASLVTAFCGMGFLGILTYEDREFDQLTLNSFKAAGIFFGLSFILFSWSTQSIAIVDNFELIDATICDLEFRSFGTGKHKTNHAMFNTIANTTSGPKAFKIGNCINTWKTEPPDTVRIQMVEDAPGKTLFFTRVSPEDESKTEYCWYYGSADTWNMEQHSFNALITCFVFFAFSIITCCVWAASFK